MPDELIAVGKIGAPHGIKGEIKVIPLTDFAKERFSKNNKILIKTESTDNFQEVITDGYRKTNKYLILKLRGFTSRNEVEPLKNSYLYVREEDLTKLSKSTYWEFDIVGSRVMFKNEEIGTVEQIFHYPSNDVYKVKAGEKSFLLPAIKDAISKIDSKNNVIEIKSKDWLVD